MYYLLNELYVFAINEHQHQLKHLYKMYVSYAITQQLTSLFKATMFWFLQERDDAPFGFLAQTYGTSNEDFHVDIVGWLVSLFLLLRLRVESIRETLVSLQFLTLRQSVGLLGRGSACRKAAT
jgi:putative flippase GtrA